ncbi:MAG: hypothetical protein JWM59_4359 [Verrucomicrobiales bacterium]|nr:hypothetical protein [Verrucomicrobiales bacterium]
MAEGVGFEPTVSCPTFDFESSALNRAQPPFRFIFNELCNLKIAIFILRHHALQEKNRPKWNQTCRSNSFGIPKDQFPRRHKTGRYYVRTCAGSKQKWTSLKTTLLRVAKNRIPGHLEADGHLKATGAPVGKAETSRFATAIKSTAGNWKAPRSARTLKPTVRRA